MHSSFCVLSIWLDHVTTWQEGGFFAGLPLIYLMSKVGDFSSSRIRDISVFLATWNYFQEMYVLLRYFGRCPSRGRDICICQGHLAKWKWHQQHLEKSAPWRFLNKLSLSSKFADRRPSRNGDMNICQSHRTMWQRHHQHLGRGAPCPGLTWTVVSIAKV